MNQEFIIPLSIALTIIGLLIWHALIKSAVRSANYKSEYYAKMAYRAQILNLFKQGYTYKELESMHDEKDEVFWNIMKEKEDAEEKRRGGFLTD